MFNNSTEIFLLENKYIKELIIFRYKMQQEDLNNGNGSNMNEGRDNTNNININNLLASKYISFYNFVF